MKLFEYKPVILLLCAIAVFAGFFFAKYKGEAQPAKEIANATVFNQPRALPEFELSNHLGEPITPADMQGQWSILFFGFTHCPDVCPTTMAMLARTYKLLGESGSELKPQVYMVSVDPERDTIEKLAGYVPFYHPSFIGITGSRAQIDEFTKKMGVAQNRTPGTNGNYNIDHTSALFLINPNGHMAGLSSAPHLPEVLANDLQAMSEL